MTVSVGRYGVIVPVKPPAGAKSRLAGLGENARARLAAAFAADTVDAALRAQGVRCVLAVTDDHTLARTLSQLGADVIPDGVSEDLNGALVQAALELGRRSGADVSPVALCADLPALRVEDLEGALDRAAGRGLSFVADAEGVGTTMVAAEDVTTFRPLFGNGSRAAHDQVDAYEIDVPAATLRRDVDTPADLADALALGVGPRTAHVVSTLLPHLLPSPTR